MTISTTEATILLQGDGANTTFAFPFLIPYQADGTTPAIKVLVVETDGTQTLQTLTTDYTVSGIGDPAGGIVTYPVSGSPLASDEAIYILRDLDYVQESEFTNQGFLPSTVEDAIDTLEMQLQQEIDKMDRRTFGAQTVAELPDAQDYIGTMVVVTDAAATTRLAAVTGGGTDVVLCFSNGADWVIA